MSNFNNERAHCGDLVNLPSPIKLKDDNIETCVISFQKNCIPEHRHIRQ